MWHVRCVCFLAIPITCPISAATFFCYWDQVFSHNICDWEISFSRKIISLRLRSIFPRKILIHSAELSCNLIQDHLIQFEVYTIQVLHLSIKFATSLLFITIVVVFCRVPCILERDVIYFHVSYMSRFNTSIICNWDFLSLPKINSVPLQYCFFVEYEVFRNISIIYIFSC